MKKDFREQEDYKTKVFRDYVMGGVWIFIGTLILWGDKLYRLPENMQHNSNVYYTIFGYACLFLGGWRIYKAYSKKYY